jgi:multidrug efflux pump subunit AcrA (membrane-fusion protein)
MDIVRKKQKTFKFPMKLVLGGMGFLVAAWAIAYSTNSSHKVSANTVLIDQVVQGDLAIDVRGVGTLVPKEVHWVASEVNGRVEKIYNKAGSAVKKGDLILTLDNPELRQQLEESKWELEEAQAQLNAQRVALEAAVLDQETLSINSKLNYEGALLTLNAQKSLLEKGIYTISTLDHEQVKIEVEQFKQRWHLEQKRLVKARENQQAQEIAFAARFKRLERVLARVQHQVNNLEVRASIDSVVQEMPLELGQQVSLGANVAKLARNDEFIAEVRIPEKQIYQVALTQEVTIDTKTSKVAGRVIRIDPIVDNGSVQVDVELVGALPKEARPELTVDGTIHVAQLTNSIFVKRPMFAKANTQGQVYQVNPDDNSVNLQAVSFGRSSQTHIEIKQGLSIGDNIVISDVSSWKERQIQAIQ